MKPTEKIVCRSKLPQYIVFLIFHRGKVSKYPLQTKMKHSAQSIKSYFHLCLKHLSIKLARAYFRTTFY